MRWNLLFAVALVVTSLALAIEAARSKSACYDEPKHVATGAYACVEGEFLGDDNAPIVAAFGWPAKLHHWRLPPAPGELTATGKRLGLYTTGVEMLTRGTDTEGVVEALFWPRMTSVLLFTLLLLGCALEGLARGGTLGMLTALGLVALSPALLSHGSIVSADLPLALAGVAVAMALRRYQADPTSGRATWLGLALGFALTTKLTGVVFALGVGMCLLPRFLRAETSANATRHALRAVIVFVVTITLATNFDLGFFVRQWQLVSHYSEAHQTDFYRGTLGAGSLGFYPFVLLLKLEPAYYVALGALFIAMIAKQEHSRAALPTLLLAGLVFFATMSSGYRQGFRFLLPMWPLLAIACAHAFERSDRRVRSRALVAALVGIAALTAFGARPHFLTYWNPLARGEGDAWFVDSNHDWGQDLAMLSDWQDDRPDTQIYGALYTIVPPQEYGIRYANLFDDPATLTRYDSTKSNYIVFSVSLLRMIAGDPAQPLNPIAVALVSEPSDFDLGGSIRGYELTPARLARMLQRG